MRFNKKITLNNVSFKKRNYLNLNLYEKLPEKGESGFYFLHKIKFEGVYLKFLRRRFRLMFKRKKKKNKGRKIWLNLRYNYPISKKSKNSRMGKGKGSFLRWCVIIYATTCFVNFFGFNLHKLIGLKNKLKYLYKPKLFVLMKNKNYRNSSSNRIITMFKGLSKKKKFY